jgi:starch phosphorylase
MILIYLLSGNHLDTFADAWAVQLNDTYPSIAVAELMRLLVDEHLMEWETAWGITWNACAFTKSRFSPRRWKNGLWRSFNKFQRQELPVYLSGGRPF